MDIRINKIAFVYTIRSRRRTFYAYSIITMGRSIVRKRRHHLHKRLWFSRVIGLNFNWFDTNIRHRYGVRNSCCCQNFLCIWCRNPQRYIVAYSLLPHNAVVTLPYWCCRVRRSVYGINHRSIVNMLNFYRVSIITNRNTARNTQISSISERWETIYNEFTFLFKRIKVYFVLTACYR